MEAIDIINSLDDEEYQKRLKDIEEYRKLVAAKGGIDNISKLTVAAKSKAEIADRCLKESQSKADSILQEATNQADSMVEEAQEKAGKAITQAEAMIKAVKAEKLELKKLSIELSKRVQQSRSQEQVLTKREADLAGREQEVSRKEDILSQLKS